MKLDTAHRRVMVSKVALKSLRYRVPFWLYFGNIHAYIHTYKMRVLEIYETTREPVVTAVHEKKSFQEKKER